MSDPLYLKKEFQTANEPKVHPIIRRKLRSSFVFVPSAGMRLAPELLILEFMREVFFQQHYGNTTTKARQLDPDERNAGFFKLHLEVLDFRNSRLLESGLNRR